VITVAPAGQGDRVRQNLSAIQNREFEVPQPFRTGIQ
jgi:hypothetical protein